MHGFFLRLTVALLLIGFFFTASAQTPRRPQKPRPSEQTEPKPDNPVPPEPQEIDTLKTDTDLVSVPVIVTDLQGSYIPDLVQEEFTISEDGVKQEIAFFGKINAPFHVVLMLDTSGSTQEKLRLIQQAANAFVEQLQTGDRVKVVSFDDVVRDLNEFTSDRSVLRQAINGTRSGEGTKIYDAFELALDTLRPIRGRKAVVVFSDGVDWHSDRATFASNVRWLDEEGVIVYPIRYDTRVETERIAREQAEQIEPSLPTIGVVRRPSSGTTPPTFPSDDPDSVPRSGSSSKTGPLGLPSPAEIMRRKREQDRRNDPNMEPNPTGLPGPMPPSSRPPGTMPTRGTRTRDDDSISSMLDLAYSTADGYLKTLAEKSGGKLLRADTLASLPDAFSKIAAELRTQYLLGYYPLNKERDERYRKIKVTAIRKGAVVRARPGYLATNAK